MRRVTKKDYPAELAKQCELIRLPKPQFEVKFHRTRKWRFDLAWPALKLACEVEGLVFRPGDKSRHTTPAGYTKDCEKYNEAALDGWTVLRVTQQHIKTGEALTWIQRAVSARV